MELLVAAFCGKDVDDAHVGGFLRVRTYAPRPERTEGSARKALYSTTETEMFASWGFAGPAERDTGASRGLLRGLGRGGLPRIGAHGDDGVRILRCRRGSSRRRGRGPYRAHHCVPRSIP